MSESAETGAGPNPQDEAPRCHGIREFTHGHAQQLNVVLRHTVINLAERVPLLPGADEVVLVDLDSTHRQVYGYAKPSPRSGG